MDPNRSLHRHREQFAMSRGLAWVYWRGGSIFGSEKRCWTTKLSVMNNAFNYVFYESLLAMIILSRNFFFLWGKVGLLFRHFYIFLQSHPRINQRWTLPPSINAGVGTIEETFNHIHFESVPPKKVPTSLQSLLRNNLPNHSDTDCLIALASRQGNVLAASLLCFTSSFSFVDLYIHVWTSHDHINMGKTAVLSLKRPPSTTVIPHCCSWVLCANVSHWAKLLQSQRLCSLCYCVS